ncbi:MAG: HAD-IIIA family hydrolase [Ruminococcus sp.]|nr:HAD-IIIA family hydrolase [Ruminococcus sp.]HRR75644.1 HAD-IIIA family hydrolase [Ruminococcus sp.]
MGRILRKYYPGAYADSVFSVDYVKLRAMGFKAVIFDIDNTLVHHGDNSNEEVDELFRHIHSTGLKTLLLTNNDEERVQRFIKNIDTLYICDAEKPDTTGYEKALRLLDVSRREAVCIGDQTFTDIIGANKAGIPSILVHYIQLPGRHWIGKKRYIEKLILFIWRHDRSAKGLGNICK